MEQKNASDEREKLNILIQNDMKIYNWRGFNFVGTAIDFAKLHGKSKGLTYVNAIKYVPRHRYNNMDGREQKAYDDKRKRAKRAYCIYTDDKNEQCFLIPKKSMRR